MTRARAAAAVALGLLVALGVAVLMFRRRARAVVRPSSPAPKPTRARAAALDRPWGDLPHIARVVILGVPFTGKTTFAAELVAGASRVLFFDPAGDYAEKAGAREVSVAELLAHPDLLAAPAFRIAVRPDAGDASSTADDLESVLAVARAVGFMVVVLDEVGDYTREAGHLMNRLARNGRHDGIASVFVSQVATDIPRTVRRVATHVVSFLQEDPDDLAALAKKCGPAFADAAKGWRRGAPPARWALSSLSPEVEAA